MNAENADFQPQEFNLFSGALLEFLCAPIESLFGVYLRKSASQFNKKKE